MKEPAKIDREVLQELSKKSLIGIILLPREQLVSCKARIVFLEAKLNTNSSNSSKPPSFDNPFTKAVDKSSEKKGKLGAKPGHKGFRQEFLKPDIIKPLHPDVCVCGNSQFVKATPYYTHQYIEFQSGYGPRLSAIIAGLVGNHGDSLAIIHNFCAGTSGAMAT